MTLQQIPQKSSDLWRHLRMTWQQTANEWEDEVRNQFEHDYWDGTETIILEYIQALENMVQAIESAKRAIS